MFCPVPCPSLPCRPQCHSIIARTAATSTTARRTPSSTTTLCSSPLLHLLARHPCVCSGVSRATPPLCADSTQTTAVAATAAKETSSPVPCGAALTLVTAMRAPPAHYACRIRHRRLCLYHRPHQHQRRPRHCRRRHRHHRLCRHRRCHRHLLTRRHRRHRLHLRRPLLDRVSRLHHHRRRPLPRHRYPHRHRLHPLLHHPHHLYAIRRARTKCASRGAA